MKNLRWTGDIGYRDEVNKTGISLSFVESELLAAGGDAITVELDSPGGDYFVGIQIMTMLKAYKGFKTVYYGAIVASAATAVAIGFDKRINRKTSSFMIHNAQSGEWGDQNELRKMADQLEGWSNIIAEAYAEITKKPIEEIKQLMDAETWLFGQEILDYGFSDEMDGAVISGPENKTAAIAMYAKKVKNKAAEIKKRPETVREFEGMLRDLGYPKNQAIAIASVGFGAANKTGDKKVTKEEILSEVKTLKENNGITLKEVAAAMGLESQLVDEKLIAENVSMKTTLASLDGERLAISLDKEFGPQSEENLVRAQASKIFQKMADITPESVEAFKKDKTTVALAAASVDHNHKVNLRHEDGGKAPSKKTVGGVTVLEV
jgi:ATP-dependent protease ClpP protease subunit/transcriptional regulator with XRE-family HTH domain